MARTLPVRVTATLFVYGLKLLLRGLNGSSSEPLGLRIGSRAVRTWSAVALYGMATVVWVGTFGPAGTLRVRVKVPPVALTVKVWTLVRSGVRVPSRVVAELTSIDSWSLGSSVSAATSRVSAQTTCGRSRPA